MTGAEVVELAVRNSGDRHWILWLVVDGVGLGLLDTGVLGSELDLHETFKKDWGRLTEAAACWLVLKDWARSLTDVIPDLPESLGVGFGCSIDFFSG